MNQLTCKFLKECGRRGIKRVAIGISTKKVPITMSRNESFFGPEHSVFQWPTEADCGGWPAIWGATKALGIGGGAGNHGQHQIIPVKLDNGYYFQSNGKWKVGKPLF